MKQKRKLILFGCLLILVLVLGLYYLMKDKGNGLNNAHTWICTRGIEGIASISIKDNEENQSLTFEQGKDSFSGSDGSSYTKSQFTPYLATLGYMRTEKKVKIQENQKQDYGLEKPEYTICISYDDGIQFCYDVGKFVNGLGLYISVNDEKYAYLIDIRRAETMKNMTASLYNVSLSNVKFDKISGINLFTRKKEHISMNQSEAPRADGEFYWNIFKPTAWFADTQKVEDLIGTVEEIGVLNRIKSKDLGKECGLDGDKSQLPSVTFYDTYDSELTIYLGAVQGDYVYCKVNYLEGIYLINSDILQLIDISINDIVDTTLYHYEIPSVEACTVKWQGKIYELMSKWNDAGEAGKQGQRYYLNGNGITGAEYGSIVDWFSKTKIKKVVNELDEPREMLGVITVKRFSPPYIQTLTFYTLQEDESMAQVDFGQSVVYVDRLMVERFISLLKQ